MVKSKHAQVGVLSADELSSFCDQIALMLESGLSLRDGIGILAGEKENESKPVYTELMNELESGCTLCDAMRAHADGWPKYMIEMVGIGEETGRLEDTMRSMAAYYRREERIRTAAVSAVVYPLVLAAMLVVIILVLLWRVFPVFEHVLESVGGGDEVTSGMLNAGSVVGWVILGITALLLVFGFVCLALMKTGAKEKVLNMLGTIAPPVRDMHEKLSSARIAGILSLMLSSGYPVENALEMVPAALDDETSVERLREVRLKMSEQGETFSEAVSESGIFDEFHTRMIRVGAATGHEPQVMEKIASLYEEKAEDGMTRLIAVIEPTLVALLCIVIGAILLSVMMPMAGVIGSI